MTAARVTVECKGATQDFAVDGVTLSSLQPLLGPTDAPSHLLKIGNNQRVEADAQGRFRPLSPGATYRVVPSPPGTVRPKPPPPPPRKPTATPSQSQQQQQQQQLQQPREPMSVLQQLQQRRSRPPLNIQRPLAQTVGATPTTTTTQQQQQQQQQPAAAAKGAAAMPHWQLTVSQRKGALPQPQATAQAAAPSAEPAAPTESAQPQHPQPLPRPSLPTGRRPSFAQAVRSGAQAPPRGEPLAGKAWVKTRAAAPPSTASPGSGAFARGPAMMSGGSHRQAKPLPHRPPPTAPERQQQEPTAASTSEQPQTPPRKPLPTAGAWLRHDRPALTRTTSAAVTPASTGSPVGSPSAGSAQRGLKLSLSHERLPVPSGSPRQQASPLREGQSATSLSQSSPDAGGLSLSQSTPGFRTSPLSQSSPGFRDDMQQPSSHQASSSSLFGRKKKLNDLERAQTHLQLLRQSKPASQSSAQQTDSQMRALGNCPRWVPDETSPCCTLCGKAFTVIMRRHHCFPSECTRVLTSRGFLFLDQIEALLRDNEAVLYAAFSKADKAIVFVPGELVYPNGDLEIEQELLEFFDKGGFENDALSLFVTPEHDMFVQLDEESPAETVPAANLAAASSFPLGSVRFAASACAGFAGDNDKLDTAFAAFEIRDVARRNALIELYFHWIGIRSKETGPRDFVAFQNTESTSWIREKLARVGLVEGADWTSDDRRSVTIKNAAINALFFSSTRSGDTQLADWAWFLGKDLLAMAFGALCHSSGESNSMVTSCPKLRDDLLALALRAGFAARFSKSERSEGAWELSFSSSDTAIRPQLGQINRVIRKTRTWCVTVEHKDHLIFAQRAERDTKTGVVTKASVPIVVGNCRKCGGLFCGECTAYKLELPELQFKKPVRVCVSCFCQYKESQGESSRALYLGSGGVDSQVNREALHLKDEEDDDDEDEEDGGTAGGDPTSRKPNPRETTEIDRIANKEERLRRKCIREIVETEKAYLEDLSIIQNVFLLPIRINQVLTHDQIVRLFSNVEMFEPVHREFYAKLTDPALTQNGLYVGEAFNAMCQYFKVYTSYAANHDSAMQLLDDLKINAEFQRSLSVCHSDSRAKGLKIAAYLIKPIQRVCKYPLFLRDLLKHTQEGTPEWQVLNQAKEKVDDVVKYINERKRKFEEQQRIIEIRHNIEGTWEEELVTPTRKILLEVRLSGIDIRTAKDHGYILYVFDELVVVAKIVEGTVSSAIHHKPYVLKGFIPISELKLTVIADTDAVKFSFEIRRVNASMDAVKLPCFQMFCKDEQEKAEVVKFLRGLIRESQKKKLAASTSPSAAAAAPAAVAASPTSLLSSPPSVSPRQQGVSPRMLSQTSRT